MRKLIYLDANVFIAAYRGIEEHSDAAIGILNDGDFDLVISDFLRLELLPKPSFHGRINEVKFFQALLSTSVIDVQASPAICNTAIAFASRYNLQPLDALHVSAAFSAGVDEFLTLEKPSKPMCQIKEFKVTSIRNR